MSLTFKPVLITPELAAKLLAQTDAAGFTNRSLKHAAIKKYANDMRAGHYYGALTGETIKLSKKDGRSVVIDGQNRLRAVIESNTSQDFVVCSGVPLDMFKYIDGGQPRSLEDLMHIDESPLAAFPKLYAVTGYMLYKEDQTGDPRTRPGADQSNGTGEVLSYIKDNYVGGMTDLLHKNMTDLQKIQRKLLGPASLWAYVLFRAHAQDPQMAAKFIDYFANYGEVQPFSKNLYLCAERIQLLRKEAKGEERQIVKGRHQDFVGLVLDSIVLAWNLTRAGNHLRATGAFTKKANDQLVWPGFQ